MNIGPRFALAFVFAVLFPIAFTVAADVPIDCDPAKNCKPVDPCELAPERCKPEPQPKPTPPPPEQDDPCKYCVCPAPTVPSCRKCCG